MKCHLVFKAGSVVDNERYTAGSSKSRSKTGRGSEASSDQGGGDSLRGAQFERRHEMVGGRGWVINMERNNTVGWNKERLRSVMRSE